MVINIQVAHPIFDVSPCIYIVIATVFASSIPAVLVFFSLYFFCHLGLSFLWSLILQMFVRITPNHL